MTRPESCLKAATGASAQFRGEVPSLKIQV
jgi:hypothetical protein